MRRRWPETRGLRKSGRLDNLALIVGLTASLVDGALRCRSRGLPMLGRRQRDLGRSPLRGPVGILEKTAFSHGVWARVCLRAVGADGRVDAARLLEHARDRASGALLRAGMHVLDVSGRASTLGLGSTSICRILAEKPSSGNDWARDDRLRRILEGKTPGRGFRSPQRSVFASPLIP